MSFKAKGPKTRPERVKPPAPTDSTPLPPSWPQTKSQSQSQSQPKSRSRRSSASSSSSIASFHSAHFPADEEARMVSSSNELKAQANTQFARQDFSSAIGTYDRALGELPSYLDYEMAVLQSNIAACHLKLDQWKEALESCERGLEGLERAMPTKVKAKGKAKVKKTKSKLGGKRTDDKSDGVSTTPNDRQKPSTTRLNSDTDTDSEKESDREAKETANSNANDTVVELPSDADEASTLAALQTLQLSDARKADLHRIRTKLLLRRARARSQLSSSPQGGADTNTGTGSGIGSWSNLSAALEDYKTLSTPAYFATLPAADQKTVRLALVSLPPRVDEAKTREVGEMMGKLKDLGNGILKPFGLSTDMFKVVQGEGGGYSMSFDTGGK